MSSPNRRIRPQRAEQVPEELYLDDRVTADADISGDDDDFEPAYDNDHDDTSGKVTRSRRSPSPLEDTAQQITRLRQSVTRGVAASRRSPSSSSPRHSIGRNHLSRPEPQPNDSGYDDADGAYNDSEVGSPPQTVYRPVSRRRGKSPQDTPSVARSTSSERAIPPSSLPHDDDDEPFYDDDDDFTEYDAPRSSGWQRTASRSGGITRVPRTRPGLPTAISQADLVNDAAALSTIGIGLAGLAGMAILVANRADTLAPTFATHVSASGTLENFEHFNNLWRLPLLTAMLTLMNIIAAWFISPLDRFASRFLLAAAVVVQLVAWVALIRLL